MANQTLPLSGKIVRIWSWLIGVGIFGMMLVMWWQRPPAGLPTGALSPIAAFEFAANKKEAEAIFAVVAKQHSSAPKPRQAAATKLTQGLQFDQFVIVPLYTLLLIFIMLLCMGMQGSKATLAFVGLAFVALFAGLFDTLENTYTMIAFERLLAGQLTDGLVATMRTFSILKWVFLGIALAWIGLSFVLTADSDKAKPQRIAGALFVLAGAGVGIGGVFSPLVMRLGIIFMGISLCFVGANAVTLVRHTAHP